MKLAAAGLTPTSPVIADVGTVETPDFASTANVPAVPRSTSARLGSRVASPVLPSTPSLAPPPQAASSDAITMPDVFAILILVGRAAFGPCPRGSELYRLRRTSMAEPTHSSIQEVCARIRAIAHAAPVGDQLEQLARQLEALDVRYAAERAQAVADAKRHLADLAELQIANRMVTVGTLTAGIAHELGTPLGVVLARAQMIVADDDILEARNDADEIVRQVKRMTQMCREVLDFARPRPRRAIRSMSPRSCGT